ncbi:MAG TPA: hypothetical protein PKI71_04565 [Candidatus Rifleibacterium sp.]|nr:hypothetical protein [Candidatus Rifleibacterium sp.]
MAFDLQIRPDFGGSGSELEKLVARAIGSNPVAAAAYAKQTVAFIAKAQKGALRITAARLRKRMLEAYETNSLGWSRHKEYSNWLGRLGPITVAHLARANRPISTTTKSSKAKKTGYSQRPIKMPQPYPLGGRLPKATRYSVTKDSMTVGVLNNAKQAQKTKMQLFQDGRDRPIEESSRRYLAALGVFIRRGTALKSPFRKLIDPIQSQYPPDKLFESAFIDILTGKLEARD